MHRSREIVAAILIIAALLACFLLLNQKSAPSLNTHRAQAGFVTSPSSRTKVPKSVPRKPQGERGQATEIIRLPGASAGRLRAPDSRFPGRLELTVLDVATHLPVGNVKVTATNRATEEIVAEQVLPQGRGTIDLPNGGLFVWLEHPEYQERRLWIEFNSSAGMVSRQTVELRRELQVTGFVTDQNEAPVSGATLLFPTRFLPEGQIVTDAEGKFTCRLPSGPVRGTAYKAMNSVTFNRVISATGPTTLRITLPITNASISFAGHVLNQKDEPIEGAVIRVRMEYPPPDPGYKQTTEEDGAFSFNLPPRTGVVSISCPGAQPYIERVAFSTDLQRDFVIESYPAFNVTLMTPEGKTFTKGFRVDGIGTSVSKIFKLPDDRYYATDYPVEIRATATEVGYGNSEVARLAAYEPDVTLRIERGGTLRGRAVDQSGQPITRFVYLLLQGHNLYLSQSLMNTPDGSFTVRHIAPGRYTLRVVAHAHPDEEREISIEASRDCFVEMVMR